MKPLLFMLHLLVIAPAILGQPLGLAFPEASAPGEWDAQSPGLAIGYLMLFGAVCLVMVIEGYKLFEKCTASELHREQGVNEANRPDRPGEQSL